MVNIDALKQWAKALRSGQYRQTTGVLHDDHGHCCMGVLCDVYRQVCGGEWVYDKERESYRFLGRRGFLPEEVMAWVGLNSINPEASWFVPVREFSPINGRLSHLNDTGRTFDDIADLIEEKIVRLESEALLSSPNCPFATETLSEEQAKLVSYIYAYAKYEQEQYGRELTPNMIAEAVGAYQREW